MTTRAEALAAVDSLERMAGGNILAGRRIEKMANTIREALQQLPEVEELAEEPIVEESPIYIAPWERALLGVNVHPDAIEERREYMRSVMEEEE
jgi:hypothetical protein